MRPVIWEMETAQSFKEFGGLPCGRIECIGFNREEDAEDDVWSYIQGHLE